MKKGILLGVCLLFLCVGCNGPKTGPKFDARQTTKATLLTNLTQVTATNRVDRNWLQAPTNVIRLGPGDRIEVELLNDPGSRTILTVGPDGKVYFNLASGVDVWGKTVDEAEDLLERELEPYVTAPQIAIHLRGVESQRVWVLGRVQNSGVYPIANPTTVLDAIAQAGGALSTSAGGTTEELADLRHAFIIREGNMLPVDMEGLLTRGDMSQNIYLQPDDFIYIPSTLAREVYVLGAVRQPRMVTMLPQMSLTAAIAGAGGPVKGAYLTDVAVVRGSLSKPQIAVVNYEDVLKGKAPDVLIERGDIIYVPLSPYRYLTKYADLILTTFVRSVAINEGARAAVKNAAPAGVTIGVGSPVSVPVVVPAR
ncbi:MAG TPA: SLBB domain-containing protein [Methylomirabilota bacterium]|nr:SLBB domain-containing protein [Methylomirabilota bacterium]